ncbi:MAG: hypothetical protein KKC80_03945 [Candidatus Margulisbacteria bacterium]|nr:hypothetical protein [Candidatus Margulisiibacteriota bacterium]MBU1616711.1 hypothetical protein [Candidatus Margulisiibacteriota bacterium]MBU1867264.1 hypothetical protein [Candidatus Margulisiibacteriota bacterium]
MKYAVIIAILAVLLMPALAAEKNMEIPVKELYTAPSEDSNLVYSIPIEVKMLDMSADGNWYKVKISYSLGPFSYTYVGWTRIPVGEVMAEREQKAAERIALTNKDKAPAEK